MFERGRKDGSFTDETGGRPIGPAASPGLSPSAKDRARECAVIGQSIKINGDLRGDEDLLIEGDVSGTVQLKNSSLTIGRQGQIKADVYAKSIVVDGTLHGDLYASESVGIRLNARVVGNITAPRVSIEDGAKFKGSVEMDQEAVEKAVGRPSTQATAKPGAEGPVNKGGDAKLGAAGVLKEAASS